MFKRLPGRLRCKTAVQIARRNRNHRRILKYSLLAAGLTAMLLWPTADSVVSASVRPAGAFANPFSLGALGPKTAPKLIVLLHGATPSPTDSAMPLVPEPNSDTLDFARFYFGYDFVRQLMGAPSTLKTLDGVNVTGSQWDAHGPANASHKVVYTNGCDENDLDHYLIVPGSQTGSATPVLSLMLTHRDGSRGLMPQTSELIKQVHSKYVELFGSEENPKPNMVRPNIIFVTHSMGGSVVRALLTAPTDSVQEVSLSATTRMKAIALRDKTIAAVTLAAPHQGSPLADRATEMASWLQGDGKGALDAFSLLLPFSWRPAVNDARLDKIKMLGKDANRDLRRDFWTQMNTGVLAPHLAKRSDNTLIPIYTLIGHSTAGRYFVNPDTQWPTGGITDNLTPNEANRREIVRSVGLMFADYGLHNVPTSTGPKSWGSTGKDSFDIVARYHRKNLGVTLSEQGEDQGIPLGIPKFYNRDRVTKEKKDLFGKVIGTEVVRNNQDGEVDADGLVDVASGHGFRLGTSTNFYFDHANTHAVNGSTVRGSWYRIMPEESWKYTNHETIHRIGGTGQWIFANIVTLAGPLPSSGALSIWPSPINIPIVKPPTKLTIP